MVFLGELLLGFMAINERNVIINRRGLWSLKGVVAPRAGPTTSSKPGDITQKDPHGRLQRHEAQRALTAKAGGTLLLAIKERRNDFSEDRLPQWKEFLVGTKQQ